jgi:hypothetical protein
MKIILTGSTGGIGSEVLQQCLQHLSITSIVALSRRPLPASVANNPKLKVVIMEDFLSYNDSLLRQLDGSQACIWWGLNPGTLSATTANQIAGHWEAQHLGTPTPKQHGRSISTTR